MTTLDRFGREYQQYHELSDGRRLEQGKTLRDLEAHAGKPPEECGADEIKSYLASLSESGLHVNTVRKKLNMLKPFYGWAYEARLIDAESFLPIQRIDPPQKSQSHGLPRPYSRKELDRFWADLDAKYPRCDDYFWRRYQRGTSPFRSVRKDAARAQTEAIVALALHCGLRRSEIFNASIDDLHYDNEYVVVRFGKGGRERQVPHTATSRAKMKEWIEVRARFKPRTKAVWLSLWGTRKKQYAGPMPFDTFERFFDNIGDGYELHRFRHTCGTEWLRKIKRVEIVQKLLGHASIQQTLGYAKVVRDDLADAVAKAELEFDVAVGAQVAA